MLGRSNTVVSSGRCLAGFTTFKAKRDCHLKIPAVAPTSQASTHLVQINPGLHGIVLTDSTLELAHPEM